MFLLTGNAAVHHPADHAEQEEQITHEVAVIPTSCGGETNMSRLRLITLACCFVLLTQTVEGEVSGKETLSSLLNGGCDVWQDILTMVIVVSMLAFAHINGYRNRLCHP